MSIESVKYKAFALRDDLMQLQAKSATRERAIALTHVETALLWLHKAEVDSLDPDLSPSNTTES